CSSRPQEMSRTSSAAHSAGIIDLCFLFPFRRFAGRDRQTSNRHSGRELACEMPTEGKKRLPTNPGRAYHQRKLQLIWRETMADQVQWQLSGDYFENCNCSVVCPCLVSKAAPLTSRPTEGVCNVPLIFHIESGRYDGIALDGLNVALAIQTPGPMAEGNWSVAAYIAERADDKQTGAL